MITLITLFLPAFIVLEMLWDFGEPYECRCVVDGKLLVVAIVLCFGMWLLGYIAGRYEK